MSLVVEFKPILSFLTTLAPLAGVWLGAWLTDNRSLKERAWAQKAQAYSDTFEALHIMQRFFDAAAEDELVRRDRPADVTAQRAAEYREARQKMLRAVARQSWLLPEAVSARVARMETVFDAAYASYFEDLDASSHECQQAAKDLRELARRDMLGSSALRS